MGEFMAVGIESLRESKTNPRRRYDERGMAELVESVKQVGVLVPLLVRRLPEAGKAGPPEAGQVPNPPDGRRASLPHRPQGGARSRGSAASADACTYEIVAGSRRYRAAKLAGLADLPVRVMELSDDQVLELQVIENVQREDVHPLDEAIGYRRLLETGRYDAPAIAAKVGKSESYVYQRLKLGDLIEEAQAAFLKGEKVTAGHAILIARLTPAQQKQALKELGGGYSTPSVRALANWIHRRFHLSLSTAPFRPKDADLLPKVGVCTTCPKRTGTTPALFPDIEKADVCTDSACYQRKVKAFLERAVAGAEKQAGKPVLRLSGESYPVPQGAIPLHAQVVIGETVGKAKPVPDCPHARLGMYVSGRQIGKTARVCAEAECKVHRPRGKGSGARAGAGDDDWRRQRQIDLFVADRVREELAQRITSPTQPEAVMVIIWESIRNFWMESDEADIRAFGELVGLEFTGEEAAEDIAAAVRAKLEDLSPEELAWLPFRVALSGTSAYELRVQAEELGLDLKALQKEGAAEVKAREKAAAAEEKAQKAEAAKDVKAAKAAPGGVGTDPSADGPKRQGAKVQPPPERVVVSQEAMNSLCGALATPRLRQGLTVDVPLQRVDGVPYVVITTISENGRWTGAAGLVALMDPGPEAYARVVGGEEFAGVEIESNVGTPDHYRPARYLITGPRVVFGLKESVADPAGLPTRRTKARGRKARSRRGR